METILAKPGREVDPAVTEFVGAYSEAVGEIVLELRGLVQEVAPDVIEQVDFPARLLAYGLRRTYKDTLCVIMPLKSGVNLGFPRGAELPDPTSLLSGTGRRARHVCVELVEQAHDPALRMLLEEQLSLILAG
jgi:hypothetical protein